MSSNLSSLPPSQREADSGVIVLSKSCLCDCVSKSEPGGGGGGACWTGGPDIIIIIMPLTPLDEGELMSNSSRNQYFVVMICFTSLCPANPSN